jgi:hypothetical protein
MNSNSKNSNINIMFSTNSKSVYTEKTQLNNVSEYFDKKIIGIQKCKNAKMQKCKNAN